MAELIYGEVGKLDVLCFGPHPDDAEIGAGGVLAKLSAAGRRCGIVDMTRGEMGTGGDEQIRRQEAVAAAQVLGLVSRENMDLPDCGLEDSFEYRKAVAEVVRKYRPEVVLGPYYDLPPGRGLGHNDHIKGGLLVAHGSNYAHLKKLDVAGDPWHPQAVYYYFLPPDLMPSFVVNVTEFHQQWMESIFAHESQFGRLDQNPGIRFFFESMATRWGRWAGGRFAQAFYSPWPLSVDDVLQAAQVQTESEERRV
ncbi:MAG TPA: bacillithiol biosynthesis deacetylase BshB1 [Firmicutes bacterium]|nr:bacillithiol biosynthesis deacetylase BshB1 [Bacillota bacterium]